MPRVVSSRIVVFSFCVWAVAAIAGAQQGTPPPAPGDGSFVFAPEIRITNIDGRVGELAGGYGGWLRGDGLLLGAGGYGLIHSGNYTGMTYGGFVAGYSTPVSGRARVGVRGLVGIGRAHLMVPVPPPPVLDAYQTTPYLAESIIIAVGARQHFIIFEPQVTAESRVSRRVSVELSAGYRVVAAAGGHEGRLRGAFGGVGVKFGPF